MAIMRRRALVPVVMALTLAACTSSGTVPATTQPVPTTTTVLSTTASLGTGRHGILLIETSACAGAITDAMFRHPPHVQLTIQRLGDGGQSYRALAWRKYRVSVPAGRYRVSEPGVEGERSVLTTVQKGRTINVVVGNGCI